MRAPRFNLKNSKKRADLFEHQTNPLEFFLEYLLTNFISLQVLNLTPIFMSLMLDDPFLLSFTLFSSPSMLVIIGKNIMIGSVYVTLCREIAQRRWGSLIANILFIRAYKLWVGVKLLEERSSFSPCFLRGGTVYDFYLSAFYYLLLTSF